MIKLMYRIIRSLVDCRNDSITYNLKWKLSKTEYGKEILFWNIIFFNHQNEYLLDLCCFSHCHFEFLHSLSYHHLLLQDKYIFRSNLLCLNLDYGKKMIRNLISIRKFIHFKNIIRLLNMVILRVLFGPSDFLSPPSGWSKVLGFNKRSCVPSSFFPFKAVSSFIFFPSSVLMSSLFNFAHVVLII